jgi:hypothetical protein
MKKPDPRAQRVFIQAFGDLAIHQARRRTAVKNQPTSICAGRAGTACRKQRFVARTKGSTLIGIQDVPPNHRLRPAVSGNGPEFAVG